MLRVFAIQIQEHFRFEPDWYRTGEVAGVVLHYYALLRSVLRTRAELRSCLARCRHCRIFFVAAACNAGRKVGCPFGCACEHRRLEWRQTSAEYYQNPQGKKKKSALNQRRKSKSQVEPEATASPQTPENEIPPLLVRYVQRVVSAIEKRRVSGGEILAMLSKEKRQHSLVRQRRVDHIIRSLHERPP